MNEAIPLTISFNKKALQCQAQQLQYSVHQRLTHSFLIKPFDNLNVVVIGNFKEHQYHANLNRLDENVMLINCHLAIVT